MCVILTEINTEIIENITNKKKNPDLQKRGRAENSIPTASTCGFPDTYFFDFVIHPS